MLTDGEGQRPNPSTYQSANADEGVDIGKVLGDVVFGGVEERDRERGENHSLVKPGNPGLTIEMSSSREQREMVSLTSFIRKPNLSLNLDACRDLLRNANLRRDAVDRMVISNSGPFATFIFFSFWDVICAQVTSGTSDSR